MDQLRVESFYLLLKDLFLLPLLVELMRALLKRLHHIILIFLNFPFLFFKLNQFRFVNQHLIFLLELYSEPVELVFILPDEGFLVKILIDRRFVLDALGTVGEFKRGK